MKTNTFNLKGSIVAIVTPFNTDDSIDYEAYKKLIEFQLENGTDAIVVCGTTGETPTLTNEEYNSLIDFTVKHVNKLIPVIAGVGSNSTNTTLSNIKAAESLGVDGLLVVSPYYNKPTEEGLFNHFSKIAVNTTLPIILYNVPARTGGNMSVNLTLKLANQFTNIIAIKEASGNMTQIMEIIAKKPIGFKVFSGDDQLALPIIALGGEGCISVIGNEIPLEFKKLIEAAMLGNFELARTIHNQYFNLMQLNFIESNPAPVKAALNMMGHINANLRSPLCLLQKTSDDLLRKELQKLGLIKVLAESIV